MKKIFILGAVLGCLVVYLISCTSSPVAGNGTRIGNPAIVGMIYKPDGKTPAPNATVFLRKKNSLPEIGLKKQASDIAIVTTGDDGRFEIDSVANGTYVIECNDRDDNYALYDSVEVENSDTTVNLPADTLKPAGVLSGTIILPEGSDFSRVYVLVFGVQRFSIVDSNGHFIINNLAEGHYDLRIASSVEHYEKFDTTMVHITSGNTTNLIIEMLYNGIPLAKNLTIQHYDTLSQTVSLTWNTNGSSEMAGYNIYRKAKYLLTDSLILGLKNEEPQTNTYSFSKINSEIVTDTTFSDSNVLQNQTYIYTVTAIDKNLNESSASNEISATITTFFSTDTLFEKDFGNIVELKGNNPNKVIFKNGIIYIVANNEVRLYDTLLNILGVWNNLPMRPYEIAADNYGRIYVSIANFANNEIPKNITSIYVFNQNEIIKKLNLTDTLDSIPALGIETLLFTVSNNGNIIFIKDTKDSIYICDSVGSILRKVSGEVKIANISGLSPKMYEGITTLITDNNNNIYVFDIDKGIKVYNSEGNQVRVIDTKYSDLTNRINVDPVNGNIYLVSNTLLVLSLEGSIITKYSLQNGGGGHIILAGDKIYSFNNEYLYNIKTETNVIKGRFLKLTNNLP